MTTDSQIASLPVSISLVALSMLDDEIAVLSSRRPVAPHKGRPELPWSTVAAPDKLNRSVRDLAHAHDLADSQLRQLGVFDTVKRDPRGPNLILAWWVPVPADVATEIGGFQPVSQLEPARVAFGVGQLIGAALARLSDELVTTTVANQIVPSKFTMAELRQVYEAVWGVSLDAANFHRKVTKTDDLVVATDSMRSAGPGRPAVLYRPGRATVLSTPMARPV